MKQPAGSGLGETRLQGFQISAINGQLRETAGLMDEMTLVLFDVPVEIRLTVCPCSISLSTHDSDLTRTVD